jgi:hypothetical protein
MRPNYDVMPTTILRKAIRLAVLSVAVGVTGATLAPASYAARLSRPRLQAPANNVSVQSLPAFDWAPVRRAAVYDFELAADRRFGAIVSKGSVDTHNTAVTLDKSIPDGTYYWRIRAITAHDSAGPWSQVRRLVKVWATAPALLGPDDTTVQWPSQPLVLRWSPVAHATRYIVTVATDSRLATQVIGSASNPTRTYGTSYTPSAPLTQGTYFWAITPLDAEGHKGTRSVIGSFNYEWPTTSRTTVADLNPDSRVFEPMFSWTPVAGAARYQVEVNSAQDFPGGSKWCCTNTTIGTSMAPTQVLANNEYYWRVRAIDISGNAGVWNYGTPFTKAFDSVTPTIPNLQVVDISGNPLANSGATPASTDTPIVTWAPVPGASSYQIQLTTYDPALGCDWSQVPKHQAYQAVTATTAWTPLGNGGHVGAKAWPSPQSIGSPLVTGHSYCLRVLARSDDDAQGGQVVSDWTQINGLNEPAFKYVVYVPPSPGAPAAGLPMPATNYLLPTDGTTTPHTPLFTWQRVQGAQGYYVVIARDALFTQIADMGYTNVPAYAPELENHAPLSDETTTYYWAVLPTTGSAGAGEYSDWSQDSPQTFNKSSGPPTLLAPYTGATVSTQPTFRWTSAENARNYTLQVSGDPSFGTLLDNVTTDETAYTSDSTYPADRQLYWRVRATDWIGQGLNWSTTGTFVKTLPIPAPSVGNPTTGQLIPVLTWAPVQGATSYDIHVDWVDGTTLNFNLAAPAFTASQWTGVGVWRWEVRADFPSNTGGKATSGYSSPQLFVRTLPPPTGAHGVKTRTRLQISWNPDPAAKQYEVQISTTDGFSGLVDTQRTDSTSWAPDIDLTKAQNRGRLYWRVAALDSSGNVGTFETASFGRTVSHSHHKAKPQRRHKHG